jgi:hypothetical protein
VAVVVLVAACASCHKNPTEVSGKRDSLSVADSAPAVATILEEPSSANAPAADPAPVADKQIALADADADTAKLLSGCDLCHIDVVDEYVGTLHFKEGIGCIKCHGASDGHVRDENNDVKPEEVFARPNVDRLCGECHECCRTISPARTDADRARRQVCTDCHGSHRFPLVGPEKAVQ